MGLGNIRYRQGLNRHNARLLDDSVKYHERALAQFESTIGDTHVDTADARYAVARHCLRLNDHARAK